MVMPSEMADFDPGLRFGELSPESQMELRAWASRQALDALDNTMQIFWRKERDSADGRTMDRFLESIVEDSVSRLGEGAAAYQESMQSDAQGLGVTAWENDQLFSGGVPTQGNVISQVMEQLNRYVSATIVGIYGGHFGTEFSAADDRMNEQHQALRRLVNLLRVFPMFNPTIKRMIEIRTLYALGSGFSIRGESISKKKERIRMQHELRQQQMADMAAMGLPPGEDRSPGSAVPDDGSGQSANVLNQRNSAPGRAASTPGGPPKESAFEEAGNSGAGGGMTAGQPPRGSGYTMMPESRESRIAKTLREFWADRRVRERLAGADALARLDKTLQTEGNAFVGVICDPKGRCKVAVWPTITIERIVFDSTLYGNGEPLGYVLTFTNRSQTGSESESERVVVPAMIANDLPLLREVLSLSGMEGLIDKIQKNVRVYHMKEWQLTGDSWGLPSILAGIEPAVKAVSFIDDFFGLAKVQRKIGAMLYTNTNNPQVSQIHQALLGQLSGMVPAGSGSPGTNRQGPTTVGMSMVSGMSPGGNPGTRVENMRTGGLNDPPSLARQMELLAFRSNGVTENMMADSSQGTLTTAYQIERSAQLQFEVLQQRYTDLFKAISHTVVEFTLGPDQSADTEVEVVWPAVQQNSLLEEIQAMTTAYQVDGLPWRILVEKVLIALKLGNIPYIMQMMFPSEDDGFEFATDRQREDMATMGMVGAPADGQPMGGGPRESIDDLDDLLGEIQESIV